MKGQPIETAPKDGTKILGARFDCSTGAFEFGVIKWYDETWQVCPSKDGRLSLMAHVWFPLPDPCASAQEGE